MSPYLSAFMTCASVSASDLLGTVSIEGIQKKLKAISVFSCMTMMIGCMSTGHDFVRPPIEQLALHQTTQYEVITLVGRPHSISHTVRNEKHIDRFQYFYFSHVGFVRKEGAAGRMASFYFADGLLIGYLYTSNFPTDTSDFDSDQARNIPKGQTTKLQVIDMLGRPAGEAVFPLFDRQEGSELRYSYTGYTETEGKGSIMSKNARFIVDSTGVITEAEVTVDK